MTLSSTTAHWLTSKNIVISGLGVGGCSFAISLHQACVAKGIQPPRMSIYERDTQLDQTKGYNIGIRSDGASGGIQVLDKLGILPTAVKHHIANHHYFSILDRTLNSVVAMKPVPVEQNLRLSRYMLRKLMIDAVPESVNIHWGKPIVHAQEQTDGTVKCKLADDSEIECDILIAADGSSSKIRQCVRPDLQLQYNGVASIFASTKVDSVMPAPYDTRWGLTIAGDSNYVFVGPPDRGSTIIGFGWKAPQLSNTGKPKNAAEEDEIIAEMRYHSRNLAPAFQKLIDNVDRSSLVRRNNYQLPPSANKGSIILIGDANHPMPPTAGNGANMALMDGYELSQQLVASTDLKSALIPYDKEAMPRSAKAIKVSKVIVFVVTSKGIVNRLALSAGRMLAWWFGLTMKNGDVPTVSDKLNKISPSTTD